MCSRRLGATSCRGWGQTASTDEDAGCLCVPWRGGVWHDVVYRLVTCEWCWLVSQCQCVVCYTNRLYQHDNVHTDYRSPLALVYHKSDMLCVYTCVWVCVCDTPALVTLVVMCFVWHMVSCASLNGLPALWRVLAWELPLQDS